MPLLQLVSRVLCNVDGLADQIVPEREVECIDDVVIVRLYKVEESFGVGWRVELLFPLSVEFLVNLLENMETCPSESVLPQVLDCSLTSANVLDDYPV